MAIKMHGSEVYNAQVFELFQEDGMPVFYVRPFTQELIEDLNWQMATMKKQKREVTITERNGTYCVRNAHSLANPMDFTESMWGMLFKRFMAEARNVKYDQEASQKYYAVIFSNEYIEPCARRLAV